jgi:MoxR-like ATPase
MTSATASRTEANHKPATVAEVQRKFATTRRELGETLIERDDEIDVSLTAIIAREHALFVGPPGCAKSLLMDSVVGWLEGPTFSVLLHRSIPVDELMGAISVKALRERDVFQRNVQGRLPSAVLASLDEIFKASPVSLSPLLRILNERVYEDAGTWTKSPLHSVLAGSNEWPSNDDSGIDSSALFDRFILRHTVRPVATANGANRLLGIRRVGDLSARESLTPKLSTRISPEELKLAQEAAAEILWTDRAADALLEILRELKKEGVTVSDRRRSKAPMVVQAYAFLCGASQVETEHLSILSTVLWDEPGQATKVAKVVAAVANPTGMRVNQLLLEAEGILGATDARDLNQAAAATSKLREIAKQLKALPADDRVARAFSYVQGEVRRISMASIEIL